MHNTIFHKAAHLLLLTALVALWSCQTPPNSTQKIDKEPSIFPSYSGITIPYNIAPLNFLIEHPGESYYVRIRSDIGREISIRTAKPTISIPLKRWRKLLANNTGNNLYVDVFIQKEGTWSEYRTITNTISGDRIDSHLAYRHINNGYVLWRDMGIYQRNLENFKETPIIENKSIEQACINCHSFGGNSPERMLFHVRRNLSGTVVVENGNARKVETNTDATLSSGVYPDWHPKGSHVVFSVNQISQRFTSEDGKLRHVVDGASDIVVYDTQHNIITTAPQVSTSWRENTPAWSASGNEIFFITAPEALNDSVHLYPKYSLMRVPYSTESNEWGAPDTLIDAGETNLSFSFPKPSPDGRFLLFSAAEYGYFHIYYHDSNLYLMDLETMQWRKLEASSNWADSYHSWSKNGRWFVFASKRMDGIYSRPFIAHVDTLGNVSTPFAVPQKDPQFYRSFLQNYNVPQLVDGRVKVSPRKLRDAVHGEALNATFDPTVDVDAMTGATRVEPSLHE